MIKLIEGNLKANSFCLRPTLILNEDNNETSAQDVGVNFAIERKDAQQAMWNVTSAIKQDTSAICATNVNNSNKHL